MISWTKNHIITKTWTTLETDIWDPYIFIIIR